MNKKSINQQNANSKFFLSVLQTEGVLNDRILRYLEKLSSAEKIRYCRTIIHTKDLFIRLFKKTKDDFPYDYEYDLKNIDLLSKREICEKLKDLRTNNSSRQKMKKYKGENKVQTNITVLKSSKKIKPKKALGKKTNKKGYNNTAEENRKRTSLQQKKSNSNPAISTTVSIRTVPGGLPGTSR